MSDFKSEMHQIVCRLGDLAGGAYSAPQTPNWILGATSKGGKESPLSLYPRHYILMRKIITTDRWTRTLFSEVFSLLNSVFTPVFNAWLTRCGPTTYQVLPNTSMVGDMKLKLWEIPRVTSHAAFSFRG